MRRTTSPNLSPLQFLRIVASEYLAAYESTGEPPAGLSSSEAADYGDKLLADLDRELGSPAEVIDISNHPAFDASALKREWDPSAIAQPSIGA